ncbi:hypothetical protein DXG01_003220 [Tephrocybe rancida]|nr:hypothetical protein DXG01_003220 [Tephrocybe rancida]
MGKLNIAHHKSYHPYRRDNIEKVRRDEEEARQKEAKEEGRMMLADSEARIDQLRERAGVVEKASKKKRKDEDLDKIIAEGSSTRGAVLPTTGGHINFFEDLEHTSISAAIRATKKVEPAETEKGVPLAPSAKDLNPWYSERNKDKKEETMDDRRKRDAARKSIHDPLTSITKELASRSSTSDSSTSYRRRRPRPPPEASMAPPEVHARLTRESSERERALELIRRKKRELAGSATPSTVHGGVDQGYDDVFNRREVEDAHRAAQLKSLSPPFFMDTTKKAQGSSLEVQRRLREVRSAVRDTMPYGKQFVNVLWDYSPHRIHDIAWTAQSETLLLWCEEVFNYLRNLRKQDFLHKKHPPLNFEQYPKKLYENAVETGGSARVYHGSHDGQEVAIKEFRLYANRIPQAKKRFLKESYITKIMHHPNIITFIGTVQEPFRICIIIPWMKNGDIVNYLAARSSPEPSKKELLEQVADGLHFVHEYGFAHGDLKGGNVLISDDEKALISDFGVATLQEDIEAPPIAAKTPTWRPIDIQTCKVALRESGMPQSLAPSLFSRVSNFSGGGTFRWMAPERLMPKEFGFKSAKPTFASDVFSYAMLAVEVYTGAPPHALETQQMAAIRTVTGKRPERPANAPDLVWEIIEHCWRVKADERPLMLDVYSSLACIPC